MSIFSLGYKATGSLSLSGKIFLIALLLSVSVASLLSSLNKKYNEVIDFAEMEGKGVRAIVPIKEPLLAAQKHRGVAQKFLSGQLAEGANLKKIEEEFNSAWLKTTEVIAAQGIDNQKVKARIENINTLAKNIFSEGDKLDKKANFDKHVELVAELFGLITDVADYTQLTLDPDLASYYVMDAALFRFPSVAEAVAKIRGAGAEVLMHKKLNSEKHIDLLLDRETFKRDFAALSDGLAKSMEADESVKKELEPSLSKLKASFNQLLPLLEKDVLVNYQKTIVSPEVFFAKATETIDASSEFFIASTSTLSRLLEERIAKQKQERNQALLLIAAMMALSTYLFLSIRKMVSLDIKSIQDGANALANGQMDTVIKTLGKDELSVIRQSIETVQKAMGAVVKDVDMLSEAGRQGQLNIRADSAKHKGAYADLVSGLNGTLDAIVAPLTVAADQISNVAKGTIPQPIDQKFSGSFQTLADNLNQATASIRRLVSDANQLSVNAVEGRLSYRADASVHQGDFKKIIEGVNATLDAVIEPLNLGIQYVDSLAKGDLPPLITKEYKGEFSRLTNSLNTAIGAISNIVQDINVLVMALQRGDLEVQADVHRHQGEFAAIIGGVNRALATVAEPIQQVGHIFGLLAQGDLRSTVDAQYEGQFGALAASANTTIEKLRELMGQITESVDLITTAAREISSGNTDLSQRTEEQASSLEETAASLEELTGTVKQNADNANQANQLAINASKVAERGSASVARVVDTMNEINESSRKISDIIGVIDSIAFQTNILALNAAVEAARAGEQGRGFAVVASEVRSLAQRSASAAKEIKTLISDSVQRANSGSVIVNEAGSIMTEINGSVRRVTDIIAEISAASTEQSTGIGQVNTAVAQMDDVTQQNAALVEQAAAAAESLEDQAKHLDAMVRSFKLLSGGSASGSRSVTKKMITPTRASSSRTLSGGASLALKAPESSEDSWEQF